MKPDGRAVRPHVPWPARRRPTSAHRGWPLFLSRRAFEAVTGPKLERWLVLTVGTQVTAVGLALGRAAHRDRVTGELRLLGAGAAAELAAIDLVYVARRRISPP